MLVGPIWLSSKAKVDLDNFAASAANISEAEGVFRFAILAFVIVGLLDLIVAWALIEVLQPRAGAISTLVAILRYVFGGILLIAAGFLVSAAQTVSGAENAANVNLAHLQIWLEAFSYTWDLGLLLFACHLLVLGYAIEKANIAKAFVGLGWVVMIAGAGYLFDSVAVVMNWEIGFEFAAFLFIGEVILLAWHNWSGFRRENALPPRPRSFRIVSAFKRHL